MRAGPVICAAAIAAFIFAARGLRAAEERDHARGLVVTDDVGREVTLNMPVARAVVFNGATAELIRSVVGMKVVVGVDADMMKEPAYWPGVTNEMIVGQSQTAPNYETIIAKRPDVVFFPRNGDWQRAAETLKGFGIPVVVITGWDLARNDFNVDLIGQIFERQRNAASLLAYCQGLGDLLQRRLEGLPRKKVYLEQRRQFTTPLKGSGWNDMIERAGATNLFQDVTAGDKPTARGTNQMFEIDPEDILHRKPDLIVKLEPDSYPPQSDMVSTDMLAAIAARPGFAELEAVKSKQVFAMSNLLTHACSKLMGSLQIAKWLYPERFADVDPSKDANEWLKRQGVQPVSSYWVRLADAPR